MLKTSINLSEADIELLDQLKSFFGAKSYSEVLKKSLVQTSNLSQFVDEKGNLHVKTPEGETLVVPRRW